MEQIKKFLRSKGFALALLACLVAAAAAGVWAVRAVRDELKKSYDSLTTPQAEPAPEPQLTLNAYSGDELVYNKTLGDWRTHNGVDYACAQDAQVCAPAAGKVTAAETDGRWGSVVCIEDSAGRTWRVCGTAEPTVQVGDEVSAGQTLGRAGSIPNECGEETHIHLEVMQGAAYLDPAKLLD